MTILKLAQKVYDVTKYFNEDDDSYFSASDYTNDELSNILKKEIDEILNLYPNEKFMNETILETVKNKILSNSYKVITTMKITRDGKIYNTLISALSDIFAMPIEDDTFKAYGDYMEELKGIFNLDIYGDMNKDVLQSGINKAIRIDTILNNFNDPIETLNAFLKYKFYSDFGENDKKDLSEFLREEFEDMFCISTPQGLELPILCDIRSMVTGAGNFYSFIGELTNYFDKEDDFSEALLKKEAEKLNDDSYFKLDENQVFVKDKKGNIRYIIGAIYNEDLDDVSITVKKL